MGPKRRRRHGYLSVLGKQKAHAQTLAATIEEETRIFTERLTSPEAKEALSAFLEKRKPNFQ